MNVKVAKTAGFCFGVKRAVDMAYAEAKKGGGVYTAGPLIHNANVLRDLEKAGVFTLEDGQTLRRGAGS